MIPARISATSIGAASSRLLRLIRSVRSLLPLAALTSLTAHEADFRFFNGRAPSIDSRVFATVKEPAPDDGTGSLTAYDTIYLLFFQHLFDDIPWALLRFTVNFADVFANNAQA